jgi:ferredoxin
VDAAIALHDPRRPAPVIDPARCTGCGRCVAACPPRVLSLETRADWRKSAVLHAPAACTGCIQCAARCPFDAIGMLRGGDAA